MPQRHARPDDPYRYLFPSQSLLHEPPDAVTRPFVRARKADVVEAVLKAERVGRGGDADFAGGGGGERGAGKGDGRGEVVEDEDGGVEEEEEEEDGLVPRLEEIGADPWGGSSWGQLEDDLEGGGATSLKPWGGRRENGIDVDSAGTRVRAVASSRGSCRCPRILPLPTLAKTQ